MSGPKSYNPPKQYSLKVFNGKLNELFGLQSNIIQLFNKLKNFSIEDSEREIEFNCNDFVEENQKLINISIKSFAINYKGKFGQDKYDEFDEKINNKLTKLKTINNKLIKEKKDFLDKRDDYQSFVSYERYLENSLSSFKRFKKDVVIYLKKNIDKEHLKVIENTRKEVNKIKVKIKKPEFNFGFRKIEKSSKEKISTLITQKENQVSDEKNKIVKSIIAESFSGKKPEEKNKEKELQREEIEKLTAKINDKIDILEDNELRNNFLREINKLQKSEVFKDVYFYKEFLDNLNQTEKTQNYKNEIKEIVYNINNTQTANCLKKERDNFLQAAIDLMKQPDIKQYRFNDLETRYIFLKEKNKEEVQNEYIKQKENEFLKAQLVKCLENMNYIVIDDMKVIDFDKQSDFLLKVPDQKNYINLRVGEDNEIAYNFLIEESKQELSIEEKRKKVLEMESTCSKFKQVLKDLEIMGLKLNQTKENDSEEDALLQLPKKYQKKIKETEEQRQQLKQKKRKKKYLS